MEVERIPDGRHLQYNKRQCSSVRETYGQDSLRSIESVSKSFDRLTSFGNMYFDEEVKSKGLGLLKKLVNKNPVFLHLWNEIVVMLCVTATTLDPLFCYILMVDENRKCVGFDKKLRTIAVVLRSIIDFLYIILIVCHFHFGYFPTYNATSESVCARAWKYFLSYFTVDILAVLPLPQVVVLLVIPSFRGSQFIIAVRSLKYVLLTQYLPRVYRIYSFLKKVRWTSSILPETAGAKAAFNLFLYMLASHVIGAFWYLFTIERKATCWQECCRHCPLNCNHVSDNQNISDFCSGKAENGSATFDFGIFKDGLHVVKSTGFIQKISYCFWWGLQKLSSLGQDLKTSNHLWEIYFAATITISGLVLFALLVGNLQTYLQSTIARLEEMRLKGQDIEMWMAYHSLPRRLKKRIKKYERYRWRETKGVNVEKLLHNLPRDLRRETKQHLCTGPLSNVPRIQNMDERLLAAICDYLKPVLYIERNFIIQEGEPLDEMIFITRGDVLVYSKTDSNGDTTGSPRTTWLRKGDFYGEELLDWALDNPSSSDVPKSTKTIRAHSKAEAFVLMASDLKIVISKFWWLFSRNSPSTKEKWAPWAAIVLQLAWRRYHKSKSEKMRSQAATEDKKSQNLGGPILATGYAIRALRALRKKHEAQASNVASESSSV